MSDPGEITVACLQCGTSATITSGADPDSAVQCDCCPVDHHHGDAANSCATDHADHGCPAPDACGVFPTDGCGGGHCGLGVQDCTVCRPVIIFPTAVLSGQGG